MKKRVTVSSSIYILLIVALLLCFAIYRLLYVSLSKNVDGINLKSFAESRNTKTKTLYASRGTIFDNAGDALATSVNSYKIIAYLEPSRTTDINHPEHVVDKVGTAKALAPVLGIDENEILERLNKTAYQVEFGTKGKNLTETTKKKIEDLELPGIDFIESTQRYYKMGNFASYIIGYAKLQDDGNLTGELGIESYFDTDLKGTDGHITYQSDAYGYQLPNMPVLKEDATSGHDVYLTIDSSIQLILENAMHDLDEKYDYDWATMTVMDAKTGAIVGSTTTPSFNPNKLSSIESYLNPLVSYTYEPGSTMKIFSWAAAMEEGKYDSKETYKSGSVEVADVTIYDHNRKGWGTITYDKGFAMSSNVGAVYLAKKLGKQKLYDYYKNFGFGEKTGIELTGEVSGDMKFKYESEVATASFGQGMITVTPIQMLQALTALTNNGEMLKPYIVSKVVDENGNITYEKTREVLRQTMSEATVNKMKELMHNANYDGLSNMWQPKSVKMMIKTGTAQIANPKGGYLDGEYDQIYSLAGIFPEENPKYIIFTSVKQIVASQRNYANIITKAIDEIASYANINTEEKTNTESSIITLDNYKSKTVEDVKKTLTDAKVDVIVLGTGNYITNQFPLKGSKVTVNSKVFLVTNKSDYVMPDITNWSLSDVQKFAKLSGINVSYTGFGYVTNFSIPKDTPLKENDNLVITLANKEKPKVETNEEKKGEVKTT